MTFKNTLQRLCFFLASAVLVIYPFSHLPEIRTGHFTISPLQLLEILIVLATATLYISDVKIRSAVNKLMEKYRVFAGSIAVFLGLVVISQFWSGDTTGIYTSALLVLGVGFGGVLLYWLDNSRLPRAQIERLIITAGVVLAAFTLFQFIGNNLEWPVWLTKNTAAVDWPQIDFSRVNGFSEEPQYLATVLLLPATLLYSRFSGRRKQWMGFLLIDIAVFLALSRGGFLSHGLVALFWLAGWAVKRKWRFILSRLAIAALAFASTLILIAWSGNLSGHKGSEWVVRRYIEQASGGLLPVHTRYVNSLRAQDSDSGENQFTNPVYDNAPTSGRDEVGVVEESALGRLDTYKLAIKIWNQNWKHRLIGVGWGNFGNYAHPYHPELYSPLSIVNNQPLQILAELGLVGVIAASTVIWSFLKYVRAAGDRLKLLAYGLLLGLAIQMQFFSALHLPQLWLSLALILYLVNDEQKSRA